jgi:hypothetical protein
MNAQGLDPFHTTGSDTEVKRVERDLTFHDHEQRVTAGENVRRTSKLRDTLRRWLKRAQ